MYRYIWLRAEIVFASIVYPPPPCGGPAAGALVHAQLGNLLWLLTVRRALRPDIHASSRCFVGDWPRNHSTSI
eukprot:10176471-Karenia_brevis.AAC.1